MPLPPSEEPSARSQWAGWGPSILLSVALLCRTLLVPRVDGTLAFCPRGAEACSGAQRVRGTWSPCGIARDKERKKQNHVCGPSCRAN